MRWEYKNIWLKGTGSKNLMDLDEIDEVMNSLGGTRVGVGFDDK